MTIRPRPEPFAPSNLPAFTSSGLGITSWSPLDNGGHSFVLKITTSPSFTSTTPTTSVLKIFRFYLAPHGDSPTATASTGPYHYYNLESAAYSRLKHSRLTGTTVPEIYGVIHITPEHEHHLAVSQGMKSLAGMRRHFRELTVVGLWMEYVPGARLLPRDAGRWAEELRTGLTRIHAAGVVQGDINWRNLIVGEGEGSERGVAWVDFSTARVRGEGEGEGEWEERLDSEKGRLEGLLARAGRRRGRGC
ncbi:unnamed protein product [Tuber aestivum]|uniref:Protein kinase domain-containing protein n=1 Tax=Tuber aestivum TaxID=59557 RepID=A0A292Q1F8_9PEZI|nr:unnamed protein product [Tuber aestivum]